MVRVTDQILLRPTVIVRVLPDHLETAAVGEALVVFRGPEDARTFQKQTGMYTAAEGFQLIGMTPEAIAALLETQGFRYVHMPERWVGGDAPVDTFTAENFIRLFEESVA